MIKKKEDWTFTEHQSYAQGFLVGTIYGLFITLLLIGIGVDMYFVF